MAKKYTSVLILAALSLFAVAYAENKLPVDPTIQQFKLKNGLRCWFKQHKTPPGKISMWLHVGSGSLNEQESQRGLAHFLEHMAFNGTKHFPPGELVKYFESIGLQFGQHQNAFTSFDQTTYQLALPNTKPETLNKGLLCLSDYAFRMSLQPAEIKKEVGVVLEEMRARDGVSRRLSYKTIPVYAPGSRLSVRLPIGKKEVIETADKDLVRAYYRTWYRPNLCTLIIVGDVSLESIRPLIEKQFSAWQAPKTGEKPQPAGITSYKSERGKVITDPEYKQASFTIASVKTGSRTFDEAEFRAELVDDLGCWIVSRRLQNMIRKGNAPFLSGGAGKGYMFNSAYMSSVQVSGLPAKAEEMLKAAVREIHRARTHGFLVQELKQAVKVTIAGMERAVQTASTRDARSIASSLNYAASLNHRPMSPKQSLALAKKYINTITTKEIHDAFKRNYPMDARLIMAILPEGHTTGLTDAKLLSIARSVEKAAIGKKGAEKEITRLMETPPKPGTWATTERDKELNITTAILDNGVRCHFREMSYKKNTVLVRILLSGGIINETAENRGLTSAAGEGLRQPATVDFSSTQIRNFMTGRKVSVSASQTADYVNLSISGEPADMELGFQLVHLLLTKPKLEDAAIKNWQTRFATQYKMQRTVAESRLMEALPKLLYPKYARLQPLTPEIVNRISAAAAEKHLMAVIKNAMVEVAMVGDMKKEKMMELTSKYLGSLPKRPDTTKQLDAKRSLVVPTGPLANFTPVKSVAKRSAVLVGWKTVGRHNRADVMKIKLAMMILRKRVREEIREKRGWTYSTAVFDRASSAYRGASFAGCFFTADPDKAKKALDLARQIIESFAERGPTSEEIAVAKRQVANQLDEALKEPSFWAGQMMDLHYHKNNLDNLKSIGKTYNSFTAADLQDVLKKYIVEKNRFQLIAGSEPKAEAEK